MHSRFRWLLICSFCTLVLSMWAQQPNSCANLMSFKAANVEITKAESVNAGTAEPNPWRPGHRAACPPQILHIALKMKEVFHKVGE
jgi:hypothetical protein